MFPQANRKSLQTYSIPKFFLKRSVLYFMSFNTTTYESYMHALKKAWNLLIPHWPMKLSMILNPTLRMPAARDFPTKKSALNSAM